MKRIFACLAVLALSACGGGGATVTYNITFDEAGEIHNEELLLASLRVIERRLETVGEEVTDLNLDRTGEVDRIEVAVPHSEALDYLTDILTEDFSVSVMEEAPEDEADVVVEGHGGFRDAGLGNEHFLWLTASEEPGGTGRVEIMFTDEGREIMSRIFQENVGQSIGIFVRGQLMSKLIVDTDELRDSIVISEIPNLDLAEVFADDVNVGLRVTFTPVS